jgi:transposase-like protein
LKTSGLTGVRLVISDAHVGLNASIRKTMRGTSWQRCPVHYMRNLHAVIHARTKTWSLSAALRTIFALSDPTAVAARWDEVATMLEPMFPKAAASIVARQTRRVAFAQFPFAH